MGIRKWRFSPWQCLKPLRDPVEPAAALACADHAEHERREHLLRLECVGQARALAHLAQHALVYAAQAGADALVLGNDRERAHQTDARGEQRGKLAAQVAELLRAERARAAVCAAAGDVLRMPAGCRHMLLADTELQVIEVQLGKDISVQDKKKYPPLKPL